MMHAWEPRLFELSDTAQIHYYKPGADMSRNEPQGRLPLGGRWRVAPSWQEERQFSIKVILQMGECRILASEMMDFVLKLMCFSIKIWDGKTEATHSAKGFAYFLQAKTEEEQYLIRTICIHNLDQESRGKCAA